MSEAFILEFQDVTADQYHAVNTILGIDPMTGQGDWPAGLLSHLGAAGDEGSLVVVEVWDSRESQAMFMAGSLGSALGQAGVPAPARVEWMTMLGRMPQAATAGMAGEALASS
jgi:hypothetical protein